MRNKWNKNMKKQKSVDKFNHINKIMVSFIKKTFQHNQEHMMIMWKRKVSVKVKEYFNSGKESQEETQI